MGQPTSQSVNLHVAHTAFSEGIWDVCGLCAQQVPLLCLKPLLLEKGAAGCVMDGARFWAGRDKDGGAERPKTEGNQKDTATQARVVSNIK